MVRRIGFDEGEGSGAVRRRGQRWRQNRVVEVHGHQPVTPADRARRMSRRDTTRIGSKSADGDEAPSFGRFLRNPIVFIVGLVLFNVFFIAFLILRAIWFARQPRRSVLEV